MKLYGTFSQLNPKKILVAGDLILDSYTIGKAKRISPEAPVAIVNVQKQEETAGGAGNAIMNLVSMGAEVRAFGRIGNDVSGHTLLKTLTFENVDIRGIIIDSFYQTPLKNRIIAEGQQIVRVDYEKISNLSYDLEKSIIERIPDMLKGIDLVAISDYGKGFLTPAILNSLIQTAKSLGIYTMVDPKGLDFYRYTGANLLKPNLNEAYTATRFSHETPLEKIANHLLNEIDIDSLVITRSEEGISLYERNGEHFDFPVQVKQVKDVTGAGDTVLAMMAFAKANGLTLTSAIQLSNLAAGIAIEQPGCARVTLSQLAKRLLTHDVSNKVFDAEHLHALKAALSNTPCSIVTLSQVPTPEWVAELQKNKQINGHSILAVVENRTVSESTVAMLASLQQIDFVLVETPLEKIRAELSHLSMTEIAVS